MHTFWFRLSTIFTISILLLAVICSLSSLTDFTNHPSIDAQIEVLKIKRFRKQLTGNDEVTLNLNITADLRPIFTWNTKQVFVFVTAEYETSKNSLNQISLWDHIIQDKDYAKVQKQVPTKYSFVDQGQNLRGKLIKLVLHWCIMPNTGRIIKGKSKVSEFHLPEAYT